MEAAEAALGDAVGRYRRALGCCAACGDLFEIGMLAVVLTDEQGRIQFEHDCCPEDAVDVRDSYRNPQQNGPLGQSSVVLPTKPTSRLPTKKL